MTEAQAELDELQAHRGLTEAEVAERRVLGLTNDVPDTHSRSVGQIVRANVLTPFNFLLGGLLAVIIVVGPLNDALFGGVLIANALIGIIQELRAKRTLDALAVLNSPRARVVRDGEVREVAVDEVVLDDVLELRPGDQVVVDGRVLQTSGLEIDEGLLTGESDPIVKEAGDDVLSGSFVAAGSGRHQATRVGAEAYASKLAAEARRFTLVRSELRNGINHIVRLISYAMAPTAVLLLLTQLHQHPRDYREALRGTVAGVVAMVPEGLVLLTSIAFAVGVVRLGRRRALVQELPAVEVLARVDVICLDKTGTITRGEISLESVEPLDGTDPDDIASAVAGIVGSDPNPNATLRAVAEAGDQTNSWQVERAVPFSSGRKWSGATFVGRGTWILGAPDVVLADPGPGEDSVAEARRAAVQRAATCAETGQRVVLLGHAPRPLEEEHLPANIVPRALLLLDDKVRDEAPDTLRYFADQDVVVKIISGDHPSTVAAIARRAGITLTSAVDGRELPTERDALAEVMEANDVFGRIAPQQKQGMISALQSRGHVVGMTGDGVNDVLALKEADIGIAMGSGSQATRAAAQLVLLDSNFATLPNVVDEGRRVINNVERVANLFLTKTMYAMLLAIAVGVASLPFPFLPRHLTLVGAVTIGIPGFFLALAPNHRRAHPGFVSRVLKFAIPAGFLAAAGTFAGYAIARSRSPEVSLDQARTTATLTLVSIGLLILLQVARPLTKWRMTLVICMAGLFALILALPSGRKFFALSLPPPEIAVACLVIVAIAGAIMQCAAWAAVRYRTPFGLLIGGDEGDLGQVRDPPPANPGDP